MTDRVPTSTSLAFYTQTTTLDGRDYIFRFLYNQRADSWFMNISDQDGVTIVEGVRVVVAHDLLERVASSAKPPGQLFARDLSVPTPDADTWPVSKVLELDPGLNDLGSRVLLLYRPEAEAALIV